MSVYLDNHDGTVKQVYSGHVLGTGSRSYSDCSGEYAIVWDEENQTVTTVTFAHTGYGDNGRAVVDATPEVRAKARAWLKNWAIQPLTEGLRNLAYADARAIDKGTVVKVVRGRKVPKGTVGTVFWKGEKHYGVSYPNTGFYRGTSRFYGNIATRIGFKDEAGTVFWTNIDNVDKVEETVKMPTEAQIEAAAQYIADSDNFDLPFLQYGSRSEAAVQAVPQAIMGVA